MFKLKPIQLITAKVGMREIGIAAAAMSVARQLRKNRKTTMAASNIPSIKALRVAVKLFCVLVAVDTMRSNFTSG